MNILKFLFRHARTLALLTSLTAIVSGACGIGIIALVNAVLNRQGSFTTMMVAGFIALGLGRVIATFVSQVLVAHFSQRAIADLRRGLIRKILAVPLRDFERIGTPRFMAALLWPVAMIRLAQVIRPSASTL